MYLFFDMEVRRLGIVEALIKHLPLLGLDASAEFSPYFKELVIEFVRNYHPAWSTSPNERLPFLRHSPGAELDLNDGLRMTDNALKFLTKSGIDPRARPKVVEFDDMSNLHIAILDSCFRRMFRTKSGYLGMATSPQQGDQITVLSGYSAPVFSRKEKKEDQHYVLGGDCFVLGLMKGEVKKKVDKGEAKLEELVIR